METPATPEARLEAAIRDRAEARRLASARARLDASLTEARNEVFRRKGEVARAQADVDKLERPSLSRVLAGLSGGKDTGQRTQGGADHRLTPGGRRLR